MKSTQPTDRHRMTPNLAAERARRGLPDYGYPARARARRLTRGGAGLGPLERGRLRTMIARMVTDDPETRNPAIVDAFHGATGIRVSVWTVWYHRTQMGLPNAPRGRRVRGGSGMGRGM